MDIWLPVAIFENEVRIFEYNSQKIVVKTFSAEVTKTLFKKFLMVQSYNEKPAWGKIVSPICSKKG